MEPSVAELQATLLKLMADPHGKSIMWMTSPHAYMYNELRETLGGDTRIKHAAVMEAIWSLIRQGLVYIDFRGENPKSWRFQLTDAGQAAADEEIASPDNSDLFFEQLAQKVPDASDVVLQYVREAITAYRSLCDLASTVMIGVASEAAFLEMVRAFDKWLGATPNSDGMKFRKVLNDPRTQIKPMFDAFRAAFDSNNLTIPHRLKDGIETDFLAVFTLLRIYRNDAGHPRQTVFDREDVSNHLRMLPRYLRRLYDLRNYFDPSQAAQSTI